MQRPCLYPGCGELVPSGYCDTHRTTGRPRTDATTRGYGHRWSDVSRAYRRAHPTCERCHRRPATLVHHVDGLGPGGPRGYDPANLEAVCRTCHTAAHRDLGRGTPTPTPTRTQPYPTHPGRPGPPHPVPR